MDTTTRLIIFLAGSETRLPGRFAVGDKIGRMEPAHKIGQACIGPGDYPWGLSNRESSRSVVLSLSVNGLMDGESGQSTLQNFDCSYRRPIPKLMC